MSLSIQQVRLGNWGTLGYLGQHHKPDFPYSVFACFIVQVHAADYPEHIARATAELVQEQFRNCVFLGPVENDVQAIMFTWELGSIVRDAKKLLIAAAKRFRSAGQTGRQNGRQDAVKSRRTLQASRSPHAVLETLVAIQGVLQRLRDQDKRGVIKSTSFSGSLMSGNINPVPEGVVMRLSPNGALHGSGIGQEIFIPTDLLEHVAGILKHEADQQNV